MALNRPTFRIEGDRLWLMGEFDLDGLRKLIRQLDVIADLLALNDNTNAEPITSGPQAGEGAHNPTSPAIPSQADFVAAADGQLIQRGGAVAARQSHKLEAAGANPAPATTIPSGSGMLDTVAQTVPAGSPVFTPPAGVGAVASPATIPTGKLKEVVWAVRQQHPDWTARQIAEYTGKPPASVQTTLATIRREEDAKVPLLDRVKALHAEHPTWCGADIADRLGVGRGSISRVARENGIALPNANGKRADVPQRAKPAPVEHRPAPPVQPARPASVVVSKAPVLPRGARFFLRNAAGAYLHLSCEQLTDLRGYAWIGNRDQLDACRAKFPLARDLVPQLVEKQPDRIAA